VFTASNTYIDGVAGGNALGILRAGQLFLVRFDCRDQVVAVPRTGSGLHVPFLLLFLIYRVLH